MTTAAPQRPSHSDAQTSRAPKHGAFRAGGRVGTVIVLIVSLIGAGLLRELAADRQAAARPPGTAASRSTLGNMNSFALALLLGGLRGPLVMFLWSSSENQKVDRDLKDLDAKIEWIRLLQPEFDTVHMFQIWNKAYNISVMMASPANKFEVILEALDYAAGVDEERPGDINILEAQSDVYGNKLSSTNLPEHPFYERQFREQSLTDANRRIAFPADKSFRRIGHGKPILDERNMVRADLVAPTRQRPTNLPAASDWNDGSQLQYLKTYDPFPFGVPPIAMGYNYAKRAEVAMNVEGQDPLQFSKMVIDSRPALQLKGWSEEEMRRARNNEMQAFHLDSLDALARISPAKEPTDKLGFEAARFGYRRAVRVSRNAIVEYERHLADPDWMSRRSTYISHEADMQATIFIADADADYLEARLAPTSAERDRLLRDALGKYHDAIVRFEWTVLEFYTEEAALIPQHLTRAAFSEIHPDEPTGPGARFTPAELQLVYQSAMDAAMHLQRSREHASDQAEYRNSIARCLIRISNIQEALNIHPTSAPTTSATQSAAPAR